MNDNKCPCEEGCISYAICLNLRNVRCNLLEKFVDDSGEDCSHREIWRIINKVLPSAVVVSHERRIKGTV